MKPTVCLLSLSFASALVSAQSFRFPGMEREDEIPLLTPAERRTVEAQRDEFANAFAPALKKAAASTVRIYYKAARGRDRRAAYGTVIGDGTKILTKWSEVADAQDDFRAGTVGNEVRPLKVTGVYPEEDLAVLIIEGAPLTPVTWTHAPLELGNFIVASQPDGRAAGYGVVSVLERSLRKEDQAFLGVRADLGHTGEGVKIEGVEEKSAAAEAGLKKGDVILRVAERQISGPTELQNALWGAKPGTEVELTLLQNKKERKLKVVLGSKPELKQFSPDRLLQMERMGSSLSKVREGFSHVVETDMVLEPDTVGGPVANLKGEVVGITMSRAGRTRSYVMPSAAIEEMLKKESMDPALASRQAEEQQMAMRAKAREAGAERRVGPQDLQNLENLQNLQRHQGDMAKLMERIESELEALEKGE